MKQSEAVLLVEPGYYRTALGSVTKVLFSGNIDGSNILADGIMVICQPVYPVYSPKVIVEWAWKFRMSGYKRMTWLEVFWWRITRIFKRLH